VVKIGRVEEPLRHGEHLIQREFAVGRGDFGKVPENEAGKSGSVPHVAGRIELFFRDDPVFVPVVDGKGALSVGRDLVERNDPIFVGIELSPVGLEPRFARSA
jgi:hypothetical protein